MKITAYKVAKDLMTIYNGDLGEAIGTSPIAALTSAYGVRTFEKDHLSAEVSLGAHRVFDDFPSEVVTALKTHYTSDNHRVKAAEYFNIWYHEVTDEQRALVKERNFGQAYSLGSRKLFSSGQDVVNHLDSIFPSGKLHTMAEKLSAAGNGPPTSEEDLLIRDHPGIASSDSQRMNIFDNIVTSLDTEVAQAPSSTRDLVYVLREYEIGSPHFTLLSVSIAPNVILSAISNIAKTRKELGGKGEIDVTISLDGEQVTIIDLVSEDELDSGDFNVDDMLATMQQRFKDGARKWIFDQYANN